LETAAESAPPNLDHLALISPAETRNLEQMNAQRSIRALVVHSKTFYFFDGAQPRGLSYDALQGFETFINKKMKSGVLRHHVVYIPVSRDQLIPALLKGYGDIAVANLTITPERQQLVDFSRPLMKGVSEWLITPASHSSIERVEDLAGITVHVRPSSSYHESLLAMNIQLVNLGLPPMQLVDADERFEDEDLLEMVNAGLLPAMVMDSHKAKFWQQVFDNIQVHEKVSLRDGGAIGWAFRKDSPGLKALVDEFVSKNREGTLLGNILLKRYLSDSRYIHNSLSSPEKRKFKDTAHLFQKYADRYDFDWLMVISQAYQESRLDHSAKSSVGAVGIMQLLPSTAADKNVNINDIGELENNIHAGNKYLRFIRDRYFESQPMDDINKTLFSFASYNAGPARIARLRREATQKGLDPNVWFNNVELIAAKQIGRETVQYVSNIYKYWVAYRLSRDELGVSPTD
jgi:membrane-bound lytic murein transglycosylase MltF